MKTYVIQDLLGLFHIIQSELPANEVYVNWIGSNRDLKNYAIDTDDLREKLLGMGVTNIIFYSCRDNK